MSAGIFRFPQDQDRKTKLAMALLREYYLNLDFIDLMEGLAKGVDVGDQIVTLRFNAFRQWREKMEHYGIKMGDVDMEAAKGLLGW